MKNIPIYIEFFTKMASAVFTLLLGKVLFDQTNSLWAFATAYGGEFLIVSIIQLYAGSLADKYSPIKLLILINTLSISTFIILALSYDILLSTGMLIAAMVVYIFRPFYRTCLFVLIRNLVEEDELKVLNGRVTSASQFGQVIGLSATGLMLFHTSEVLIFYVMAFIYLLCLSMSMYLNKKCQFKSHSSKTSMDTYVSWRSFFKFCQQKKPFTVRLISSFSIAVSLAGFYVLLAPLVADEFSNNEIWLSFLSVSYALGAIISGILIKTLMTKLPNLTSDRLLLLNQIIGTACFLSYALIETLIWLPALLFLFGISTTLAAVSLSSFLQFNTLDEIAGRTAAIQNIVIAAGNAFVAAFASFLFDMSFHYAAIGVALCLMVLSVIFMVCFKLYPEKKADELHN